MQIYESNTEPHTYATNLHSNGTNKRPSNNLLAALGTNYCTAFAVFMRAFKEQTGLHWDDRVTGHNARILARKQARDGGSEVVEEEEQWFRYQPPAYGARGLMTGIVDEVPETVKSVRLRTTALSSTREEESEPLNVEGWMRDSDAAEIEPRRWSSIAEDGTAMEVELVAPVAAAVAAANATVSAETARGGQEQINAGRGADPINDFDFDALMNDVTTGGDYGDLSYPFDFNMQTGGEPSGAGLTDGIEGNLDPAPAFTMDFGAEQPATNSQIFGQFQAGNQQQTIRDRASEPAASGFGGQTSFLGADQGSAHAASEPAYQTIAKNNAVGAPASSGQEVTDNQPSGFTEAFVTIPADQSGAEMAPEPAQQRVENNRIFDWEPVTGQDTANADAALAAFDFGDFNVVHEATNWDIDAAQAVELNAQFSQGLANMSIPQMSEMPEDLQKFAAGNATTESGTGLEFLHGAGAFLKEEEQSQKEGGAVHAEEGNVKSVGSSLGKRKREDGDEGGDEIAV